MVNAAAVAGSQYVNVALHRLAYQSSSYNGWFGYSPSFAVNGLKSTFELLCATTAVSDTSPWWGVDLVYVTYVYGVNLTNADNGAG